jgi:hypothetical protein
MLVSFVGIALVARAGAGSAVLGALCFDPSAILRGHALWTFATSWLVHSLASPEHLIFNGIGLYFFGPDLEVRWGAKRFVLLAALSQLAGCLLVLFSGLVGLSIFGIAPAPVLGASSIVMGIVIAWGLTYWDRQVMFFFIPMRGIHLVYITVAFEVLNALSFSPVSAEAHFGGMAAGALFALYQSGRLRRAWVRFRPGGLTGGFGRGRPRRSSGPDLRVIAGGGPFGGKGKPPDDKRYLN